MSSHFLVMGGWETYRGNFSVFPRYFTKVITGNFFFSMITENCTNKCNYFNCMASKIFNFADYYKLLII